MLNFKLIRRGAVALLALLLLILSQFFISFAYVPTDSMEPAIHADSLILINNHPSIKEGGIYTYRKNSKTIVHRIVATRLYKGKTQYQFKGDNNEEVDEGWVKASQIKGEVICSSFVLGRIYKHLTGILSCVCFTIGGIYIINAFYGKDEPKDYTTINPMSEE